MKCPKAEINRRWNSANVWPVNAVAAQKQTMRSWSSLAASLRSVNFSQVQSNVFSKVWTKTTEASRLLETLRSSIPRSLWCSSGKFDLPPGPADSSAHAFRPCGWNKLHRNLSKNHSLFIQSWPLGLRDWSSVWWLLSKCRLSAVTFWFFLA